MINDDNNVPAPVFENVQVVALPQVDPSTGNITYQTTFTPEVLQVKTGDSIINYQLIAPTPEGVQFKKVKISPCENNQLSTPSISQSGKLVTFSDANSVKETFSLTFHFIDKDGIEFQVDPDLINVPE